MPRYEYRCRSCGATFEQSRPMSEAGATAACPDGHTDTVKLLSTIALTGRGDAVKLQAPPSGGCCGAGGCGC
jgi:putative FmdB family regulatory protein